MTCLSVVRRKHAVGVPTFGRCLDMSRRDARLYLGLGVEMSTSLSKWILAATTTGLIAFACHRTTPVEHCRMTLEQVAAEAKKARTPGDDSCVSNDDCVFAFQGCYHREDYWLLNKSSEPQYLKRTEDLRARCEAFHRENCLTSLAVPVSSSPSMTLVCEGGKCASRALR